MKAENPKGTYLLCMLELLRGIDLGSDDVEQVFRLLGSLKENEDMGWLRDHVAQQFIHEVSNDWELHVMADNWLRCHGRCQLTKVLGLNPEPAAEYYDDDLCMYCRAN